MSIVLLPGIISESDHNNKYTISMVYRINETEKGSLNIVDIKPFIYVSMNYKIIGSKINIYRTSKIEGKKLIGYNLPSVYIKLEFNTLRERNLYIYSINKHNNYSSNKIDIFHDDRQGYYNVFSRDNKLPLSDFIEISNYIDHGEGSIPRYTVSYEDIKAVSGKPDNITYICCWDIETVAQKRINTVPLPSNNIINNNNTGDTEKGSSIMCISAVFCRHGTDIPVKSFIFSRYPHDSFDLEEYDHNGNLFGECKYGDNIISSSNTRKSELRIIYEFIECLREESPDILIGFNDETYDHLWLKTRIECYLDNDNLKLIPASEHKYVELLRESFSKLTYLPNYLNGKTSINSVKYGTTNRKIDATRNDTVYLLNNGSFFTVDIRPLFMKRYPTESKSSLNFYLEKEKLSSKMEGVTYTKMSEIYKQIHHYHPSSKQEMIELKKRISDNKDYLTNINKYCVIDAVRCHELFSKGNFLMSIRAWCSMSYMSLYHGFYRADGVKVRNVIMSFCENLSPKLLCSAYRKITAPEGKYRGAHVFPPDGRPNVCRLSLDEILNKTYDNVMTSNKELIRRYKFVNANNIDTFKYIMSLDTNERSVAIEELRNDINNDSSNVKPHEFTEFITWMNDYTGRPVGCLDFSSLYPSLMRAYNFSPDKCITVDKEEYDMNEEYIIYLRDKYNIDDSIPITRAEVVYDNKEVKIKNYRKELKDNNTGNDKLTTTEINNLITEFENTEDLDPECRYAYFIGYSPDSKAEDFSIYGMILDQLASDRKAARKTLEEIDDKYPPGVPRSYEINTIYDNLNVKQLAIKVFMNTIYGEAGNVNSPLCLVEVAGSITAYGVKSIKHAEVVVTNNGFDVKYGDTDSLYVALSDSNFIDEDRLYFSGQISKLDYSTRMVQKTIDSIHSVRKIVNDSFINMNNNSYLELSYEKVIFPNKFISKKKYFGLKHINEPSFHVAVANNISITGMDIKKRNTSPAFKELIGNILIKYCTLDNTDCIYDMIYSSIQIMYSKSNLTEFAKNVVYKGDPNNPDEKMKVVSDIDNIDNIDDNDTEINFEDTSNKVKGGNIFMINLVKRLNANGENIKPGDDMSIVAVRKPDVRKSDSTASKFELIKTAIDKSMSLDIDYYAEQLTAQYASLIQYAFALEYPRDVYIRDYDIISKRLINLSEKEISAIMNTTESNCMLIDNRKQNIIDDTIIYFLEKVTSNKEQYIPLSIKSGNPLQFLVSKLYHDSNHTDEIDSFKTKLLYEVTSKDYSHLLVNYNTSLRDIKLRNKENSKYLPNIINYIKTLDFYISLNHVNSHLSEFDEYINIYKEEVTKLNSKILFYLNTTEHTKKEQKIQYISDKMDYDIINDDLKLSMKNVLGFVDKYWFDLKCLWITNYELSRLTLSYNLSKKIFNIKFRK